MPSKNIYCFGDYTAAKGNIFVQVDVTAYNQGESTEHVNPNDFTLSNPNGLTVNPDTNTTFFTTIDLPTKGKSSGWLIFHKKNLNTIFYITVD